MRTVLHFSQAPLHCSSIIAGNVLKGSTLTLSLRDIPLPLGEGARVRVTNDKMLLKPDLTN